MGQMEDRIYMLFLICCCYMVMVVSDDSSGTSEGHGPCRGRVCLQNGTCSSTQQPNGLCTCYSGFSGENCTDINECEDSFKDVCHNRGNCSNSWGNYSCTCVSGWIGQHCNVADPGVDVPKCLPGYKGDHCETLEACVHGNGRKRNGNLKCVCHEGWKHNHDFEPCTIDINECDQPDSCVNGNCTNKNGSYDCYCLPLWFGKNCTFYNVCATDNPCRHGSQCSPRSNGQREYDCNCTQGWTGENCTRSTTLTSAGTTGSTTATMQMINQSISTSQTPTPANLTSTPAKSTATSTNSTSTPTTRPPQTQTDSRPTKTTQIQEKSTEAPTKLIPTKPPPSPTKPIQPTPTKAAKSPTEPKPTTSNTNANTGISSITLGVDIGSTAVTFSNTNEANTNTVNPTSTLMTTTTDVLNNVTVGLSTVDRTHDPDSNQTRNMTETDSSHDGMVIGVAVGCGVLAIAGFVLGGFVILKMFKRSSVKPECGSPVVDADNDSHKPSVSSSTDIKNMVGRTYESHLKNNHHDTQVIV